MEITNTYITNKVKNLREDITNYISNITNEYTKEDYFNCKEDFHNMRVELRKIQDMIDNKKEFFEMTFEDKFGHDMNFKSIDKEIEYYKMWMSSKKEGSKEIVKAMGCEDRVKELEKRKKELEEKGE